MAGGAEAAMFEGLAKDMDSAGADLAATEESFIRDTAGRAETGLNRAVNNETSTAESFDDIANGRVGDPAKPSTGGNSSGGSNIPNRLDPPGGVPPDPVTVNIWRDQRMPKTEFAKKATALQRLGDDGELYKAPNPVSRDPNITKHYRQNIIDRIYAQYHEVNPEFSDSLIDRVTSRMSPDHVHELQLGGPDTSENLKMLDRYTNEQIGTRQIWPQIRSLPDGTPIKIKVIDPPS